jgi:anti-sigma factor RsiW
MHRVIQDGLEEYLSGTVAGPRKAQMEAHLAACSACREELRAFEDLNSLFVAFRPVDVPEISPGFYARLSANLEAEREQRSASVWALFFEPAFARRVAFACLLMLATLGSFLVTREAELTAGPSPEMVLALDEESTLADGAVPVDARDRMLVTLVSYR